MFKKLDEKQIKKNYKPMGGDKAKDGAGSKSKGGGEPAKPKYDPKSKNFKSIVEKKNNDGAFGYGYVDENTGIEVPWYIDMINGGGANAAGPEFISPFADKPLGGGIVGMGSQAISGALNSAGVAPYGYNQPRRYAQAGMLGYPAVAANTPTGGTGVTSKPEPIQAPQQDFTQLSMAPSRRAAIGGNVTPLLIPGTPKPSPLDTAMTTPQMDQMWNIATQTVMRRFPTMPKAERDAQIQSEYQRLVNAIGM